MDIPEPEVYRRYMAGETLDADDHMVLQTFLLVRCLQEIEHVCSNTSMQMTALGAVLDTVGGDSSEPVVDVQS